MPKRRALCIVVLVVVLTLSIVPPLHAEDTGMTIRIYSDGSLVIRATGSLAVAESPYNHTVMGATFSYKDGWLQLTLNEYRVFTRNITSLNRTRGSEEVPGSTGSCQSCQVERKEIETAKRGESFSFKYFSDGETTIILMNQSQERILPPRALDGPYLSELRTLNIMIFKKTLETRVELNVSRLTTEDTKFLENYLSMVRELDKNYKWFSLLNYTYSVREFGNKELETLHLKYVVDLDSTAASALFLLPAGVDDDSLLFLRGSINAHGYARSKASYLARETAGVMGSMTGLGLASLEIEMGLDLGIDYPLARNLDVLLRFATHLSKTIVPEAPSVILARVPEAWGVWRLWASLPDMYVWAFSRLLSDLDVDDSSGFLSLSVERGRLNYEFTSLRFKPINAEGPEETLSQARQVFAKSIKLLKLVLAIEVDDDLLARHLDSMPVTLKPGDGRVAEILPSKSALGDLSSVRVVLRTETVTTTPPLNPQPTGEAGQRAWDPASLVLGAAIGLAAGLATHFALERKRRRSG